MNKEEQEAKRILNELRNAEWFGEDGHAAVNCKTKKGAWLKFRKKMREDVGEIEAEEIKMKDISKTYLHIGDDNGRITSDGFPVDCYVDAKKKSPYIVWWLNV